MFVFPMIKVNWQLLLGGPLFVIALCGCQNQPAHDSENAVTLYDNLGKYHYAVSTSEPKAQRYFDQGLILAFGFNHAEAARSFRQAYQIDPQCALCYWGEALVLGPNINAPMDEESVPVAYAAVQQALKLSGLATAKERALIEALSKRYTSQPPKDRSLLDRAYAVAMRDVAMRYPGDGVVAALFAESLMDLHPWDFWTKQGEAKPWTGEIVSTLERALRQDENNPLANHLYIHVMEASPYAEKALPSARRLPSLVPGSGHLVHMPAHIYIRLGRYRDAILANQQAVKVDQGYLSHDHAESIYTLGYVPHNHHFLWAAAIKTGQRALSERAAAETAEHIDRNLLRTHGLGGTLQHFILIPLYSKALFGEWDAILKEPAPPADLLYPTGIWHYARGLALLRKGETERANEELNHLKQIITDPAISGQRIFDLNPVSTLLKIGVGILSGEIAAHQGDYDAAAARLRQAVEWEDSLHYTEPKDWYLPPRQVLGAILLESGKPEDAEQVYRQDLRYHPQNGWSLFGLRQSLLAQGKTTEAKEVGKQFDVVWEDADVTLTSSRF